MTSCPQCKQTVRLVDGAHPTLNYDLHGPWPTTYRLRNKKCPFCQAVIACCTADCLPLNMETRWADWSESMLPKDNYEEMAYGARRIKLDGTHPVHVTWPWHPMDPDGPFSQMVMRAIEQEDSRSRMAARLIILPSTFCDNSWKRLAERLFHWAWILKPEITDGASGPYPSLRAERSIVNTLNAMKLTKVRHFWPSARLSRQDYVPVLPNSELAQAWSVYARSRIAIEKQDPKT